MGGDAVPKGILSTYMKQEFMDNRPSSLKTYRFGPPDVSSVPKCWAVLRTAGMPFAEVPLACSKPYLQQAVPATSRTCSQHARQISKSLLPRCLRLETRADSISTLHSACRRGKPPSALLQCRTWRSTAPKPKRKRTESGWRGSADLHCHIFGVISVLYSKYGSQSICCVVDSQLRSP